MIARSNRLIGAILLVSGTTIGGGVLALPVTTGLAGFFPSILLMTGIWLFMMLTAFYLLEVNLRLPGESNLISMMHKTLGRVGEAIAWVTYLLLLYSLLAAYLLGSSQILADFLSSWLTKEVPLWVWLIALFLIFGSFVYFGTVVVDFLNRFLMVGLVLGYLGLIFLGLPFVKLSHLGYQQWGAITGAFSVIVTSFGYHIIIPTLTTYLDHDPKLLKKAILIGSFIPFVCYLFWQFLAMGVIPATGERSLSLAAQKGLQATFFLKEIIGSPWVTLLARMFAFFAIMTSLLGVSLSLSDFLADGLNIKKNHFGKFLLMLLTFVPPCVFAIFYPQGFILALNYAGIFVVILLALLPALMAWFERYRVKAKRTLLPSHFTVPGGKVVIILTILLSLVLLGFEVFA